MPYSTYHHTQIGYFVTFLLWEDAVKLLKFQIQQRERNRHYNKPSIFYYESLGEAIAICESMDYFQNKIANNLFYCLEKEFSILPYSKPKSKLGKRYYRFFTYPARILYYAIGIYLLKLSEDFIREYKRLERITSFYGGDLKFNQHSLVINHNTTFYREYYKNFKGKVKSELQNENIANKVVLRLDIQNYYDEISVPKLLVFLDKYVVDSHKNRMKFDWHTRKLLEEYFQYVMGGLKKGIPQTDNDIISNFIAHLYLIFGDMLIDDEINSRQDVIENHKIIRYVDDTYISITFKQEVNNQTREKCIDEIENRIADALHYNLGLRFNTKSDHYILSHAEDKKALLESLKKVSPEYELANDDSQLEPQEKINRIFNVIEDLKFSRKGEFAKHGQRTFNEDYLKEVYDENGVNQMLNRRENKQRLEEIFTDFNFDIVKQQPAELIILILKNDSVGMSFRNYLLSKNKLTEADIDMIFNFICHSGVGLNDMELLNKIKALDHPIKRVVEILQSGRLFIDTPGYYSISGDKINYFADKPEILEQARLRIINEMTGSYSVALNHLLNEIHQICWEKDENNKLDRKNYQVEEVSKFLRERGVPNPIWLRIKPLFDRRNNNLVSHPGADDGSSLSVTQAEYEEYKNLVDSCLYILT